MKVDPADWAEVTSCSLGLVGEANHYLPDRSGRRWVFSQHWAVKKKPLDWDR